MTAVEWSRQHNIPRRPLPYGGWRPCARAANSALANGGRGLVVRGACIRKHLRPSASPTVSLMLMRGKHSQTTWTYWQAVGTRHADLWRPSAKVYSLHSKRMFEIVRYYTSARAPAKCRTFTCATGNGGHSYEPWEDAASLSCRGVVRGSRAPRSTVAMRNCNPCTFLAALHCSVGGTKGECAAAHKSDSNWRGKQTNSERGSIAIDPQQTWAGGGPRISLGPGRGS
jgi:hypothetical protein